MKKTLSYFSLVLILISSTVIADEITLTKLNANGVTLSTEQATAIRTAKDDDALIQAIANLVKANADDKLKVKAIVGAAVEARPNLVVAITGYAIAAAPSARDVICTTAITQTRGTAIQGVLTQQGAACQRYAY